METTLDKSEMLHRFAVVMKRLSSRRYPLAITAHIETDDPLRRDTYDADINTQYDFVIGDQDRWEGDLLVSIRLPDLHLDDAFVWSISPLLHEHDELVDL